MGRRITEFIERATAPSRPPDLRSDRHGRDGWGRLTARASRRQASSASRTWTILVDRTADALLGLADVASDGVLAHDEPFRRGLEAAVLVEEDEKCCAIGCCAPRPRRADPASRRPNRGGEQLERAGS